MRRILILVLSATWLAGAAAAQSVSKGLAAAEQRIQAADWNAALETLLGLQGAAASDAEREQVADKLTAVGRGLAQAAAFDAALRAHEAALSLRKLRYGDGDHTEIAASLNEVAQCHQDLGQVQEALPLYEAALTMCQGVHEGHDHIDVAACLCNLGACLRSLGQQEQALARGETALQMCKRLHPDADDAGTAACMKEVATSQLSLGRLDAALPLFQGALSMRERLYAGRDHEDVAISLSDLGLCLVDLGQLDEALASLEAAAQMWKHLCGGADDPNVAATMCNVARCLRAMGKHEPALARYREALAMLQRMLEGRDSERLAICMVNMANCLQDMGREGEALPLFEAALRMSQHLYGSADHPQVAATLLNIGRCHHSLGEADKALAELLDSLAMWQRVYQKRDHPDIANCLGCLARCLLTLGHADRALAHYEASCAMQKRIFGERDNPDVATSMNNLADCLQSIGQADKALPLFEAALAMHKNVLGEGDNPDLVTSMANVAFCLRRLGQPDKALSLHRAALTMLQRLYGDRDHPHVAGCLDNVAACLSDLGQRSEALPLYEQALAMDQRIHCGRDHPDVAMSLHNVAACLWALGHAEQALPKHEAALAMLQRLYGDRDHPFVAAVRTHIAQCLAALGEGGRALPMFEDACAMIERLRTASHFSADVRQLMFDEMKGAGAFEHLQLLAVATGKAGVALDAAERGRGRELLDMMEQQRFDPFTEAERRARMRGDERTAARVQTLRGELDSAALESDRLLHELSRLASENLGDAEREARRKDLIAKSDRVAHRQRELLDERARLIADVVPAGRVRTAKEIGAALEEGELFLEFTIAAEKSLLYVVAREGNVQALPLPAAAATVQKTLEPLVRWISRQQLGDSRGEGPDTGNRPGGETDAPAKELFESLIPKEIWPRIRGARRVFLAAHGALHRLPFEMLVTDIRDGKPVYWLDDGPEVAYVQSGSALCWLTRRAQDAREDTTSLDMLAVGDPRMRDAEPEVPEQGVFVFAVNAGGEGARIGLEAQDVLVSYDGKPLVADATLRELRMQVDAAIKDGARPNAPIPIEVWRRGQTLKLAVNPGLLGIQVGPGKARSAWQASLGTDAQLEAIERSGDLERISRLPPLRGARAEANEIADLFQANGKTVERLLDAAATEPGVFEQAAKARYLHFACHGIAEEYAGQSLSMLVLSQPQRVLPDDDGLLKLGELLDRWRGHLAACRLAVLSACRTNVGKLYRDEAPQALPLGFLLAGASSVISSLWAVDDASTRELMTDFYRRLVGGEHDRLRAFTAARKSLRAKYPDPFHWAPFLFIGRP